MLYYEDTKLKRRKKRVTKTDVNKYIGWAAKALALGGLIIGRQNIAEFSK